MRLRIRLPGLYLQPLRRELGFRESGIAFNGHCIDHIARAFIHTERDLNVSSLRLHR